MIVTCYIEYMNGFTDETSFHSMHLTEKQNKERAKRIMVIRVMVKIMNKIHLEDLTIKRIYFRET